MLLKYAFNRLLTHSRIPKKTRKNDIKSMSYSIKLTIPFLVYRVVELNVIRWTIFFISGPCKKHYKRCHEEQVARYD